MISTSSLIYGILSLFLLCQYTEYHYTVTERLRNFSPKILAGHKIGKNRYKHPVVKLY